MAVEGGSCEKDLRLVGREFHRRGTELRKNRPKSLSFEVRDGKVLPLEERVLPVGLMLIRLRR